MEQSPLGPSQPVHLPLVYLLAMAVGDFLRRLKRLPVSLLAVAVGGQHVSSLASTSDDFLALVFNPLLAALGIQNVSAIVSNNQVRAPLVTVQTPNPHVPTSAVVHPALLLFRWDCLSSQTIRPYSALGLS